MLLLPDACAPARAATLAEELSLLLTTSSAIRAAEHNLEAARHGIGRAQADFLPRVSIIGDTGYEETDSPARRQTRRESFRASRYKGTVEVTQNIFDGYGSTARRRSSEFSAQVGEAELDRVRQNVLFDGIATYLDVLRQARLVDLARANEATIQTQLQLEDERVRRGSGITADVLLAKSRLQVAKERRVAFAGRLQDAVSRYIQVHDHGPDIAAMELPEPPVPLLPASLDEAIAVAQHENPAVGSSRRAVDLASERRREARADYYPSLELFGRNNWEEDVDGVSGIRRDWSVGVRLNWEIFSGFATRSRVEQAASEYSASVSNSQVVGRRVDEELRLAWQSMLTNRERRDLLDNAVAIAQEVFEARQRLRDAGRGTLLNVLDAENEVYAARINLTDADTELRISVFRVLRAVGRLSAETLELDVSGG